MRRGIHLQINSENYFTKYKYMSEGSSEAARQAAGAAGETARGPLNWLKKIVKRGSEATQARKEFQQEEPKVSEAPIEDITGEVDADTEMAKELSLELKEEAEGRPITEETARIMKEARYEKNTAILAEKTKLTELAGLLDRLIPSVNKYGYHGEKELRDLDIRPGDAPSTLLYEINRVLPSKTDVGAPIGGQSGVDIETSADENRDLRNKIAKAVEQRSDLNLKIILARVNDKLKNLQAGRK